VIKNTASQKVGVQMVSATDGSAFTGSVTVSVTGDAGTQATGSVGSGACTHEGNGYHTYAPAQAETNYDLIAFTFTGTGAIPSTVQVYTITGDAFARLGAPAGASIAADLVVIDNFVDDLEGRLTSTRAGYLDNLSAGAVALEATAQSILDDTGTSGVVLANDAITAAKIAANAITSSELADGAITSAKFAAGAITATVIAADAIDADALAADVTTELQSGLATAANLTTLTNYVDTEVASILAAVDTEVAAIKAKTDQLTFTVANTVDANVEAVDGSATGVDKLAAHLPTVLKVIVGVGSTTTSIVLNATTGINGGAPSATNDFYSGRVLVFTSGTLAGQATSISSYAGATVTLTVVALTGAPSAADIAVIV